MRRNNRKKGLIFAFIASIVIHILFVSIHIDHKVKVGKLAKKEKRIRLVLIKKERKKTIKKQIVNSEQTGRKERDESSKFLGKSDQFFDRETVAKITGSFKKSAKGDINGKKKAHQKKNTKMPKRAKKVGKRKKKKGEFTLSDFAVSDYESIRPSKDKSLSSTKKGLKRGDLSKLGLAENNDFVDDVPLGDFTHLNTIEYKYFGFYDRIRKKLEQYWGNSLRQKADQLFKKGRRIPAGTNKITSLEVMIDKLGNITNVKVKSTSGISELDEAAVESFNRAGPFPNPPSGLVESGQAKIEWGFVVKS